MQTDAVDGTPRHELPKIALLMGDCTGIGPELVVKVLHQGDVRKLARLVVVGDARVFELGMRDSGLTLPYESVPDVESIDWSKPTIPLIDLGNIDPAAFPRGQGSSDSGRLTGDTLAHAIEMAKRGDVDGITFAPLNKRAMFDGGWKFPDEHRMFASLLAHEGYFSEMNVVDDQWMTRVTSHVALRKAVDLVTDERICKAIELANTTLKKAGFEKPRIAVAALNPHNGENGLFGTEEIEIIRPAVERMAATGIDCRGPFPSDTVYLKAFAGEYDTVLAMYHDQGQIATKLKGFERGVTVTAGLETIFTTPAHGTAFDIVGRGVARTGGITHAIGLAAKLAARRQAAA